MRKPKNDKTLQGFGIQLDIKLPPSPKGKFEPLPRASQLNIIKLIWARQVYRVVTQHTDVNGRQMAPLKTGDKPSLVGAGEKDHLLDLSTWSWRFLRTTDRLTMLLYSDRHRTTSESKAKNIMGSRREVMAYNRSRAEKGMKSLRFSYTIGFIHYYGYSREKIKKNIEYEQKRERYTFYEWKRDQESKYASRGLVFNAVVSPDEQRRRFAEVRERIQKKNAKLRASMLGGDKSFAATLPARPWFGLTDPQMDELITEELWPLIISSVADQLGVEPSQLDDLIKANRATTKKDMRQAYAAYKGEIPAARARKKAYHRRRKM